MTGFQNMSHLATKLLILGLKQFQIQNLKIKIILVENQIFWTLLGRQNYTKAYLFIYFLNVTVTDKPDFAGQFFRLNYQQAVAKLLFRSGWVAG